MNVHAFLEVRLTGRKLKRTPRDWRYVQRIENPERAVAARPVGRERG